MINAARGANANCDAHAYAKARLCINSMNKRRRRVVVVALLW